LTLEEQSALNKGLKFTVTPKQVSNLDIAAVVEEMAQKFLPMEDEE
jgi:hypothetical protein